ncbi:unnamed protein product [Colias eurytheme]|nr:unnamed protein product [Colias eurytheme]
MLPPDYCLHNLNTSDCKGTPTPVFYYYKPGSRCELGIWRGCPTYNKFDDEYLCSHNCVFKFIQATTEDNLIDTTDQCSKTITENKCKDNKQNIAYTYKNEDQDCTPIVWGDCKYPNIFKEKQACIDACVTNWQDDMNKLDEAEVKEIDKLLVEYLSNNVTETTKNKRLKLTEDLPVTTLTTPMIPSNTTEVVNVTEVVTVTEVASTTIHTTEESVTDVITSTRGPKGPAREVELP